MIPIAELVAAAKKYDFDTRPKGNWTSVPDSQVARLLTGARIYSEQRQDFLTNPGG